MTGITNLRLEPARLHALKQIALDRGISLSALLREMADEVIRRHGRERAVRRRRRDPFFLLGRPGVSAPGPTDVAAEHDHYLYGSPKKRRR